MDTEKSFEAVLERLTKVTGVTTDSALARVLQIKPQSVVAARKRGQVPPGWIVAVAQEYGVTTDWLFFGRGPVQPDASGQKETYSPEEKKGSPSVMADVQETLARQEKRIAELEKQLADAKEETLKAYRLAVEAMRPAVESVQVPPPPRYGQAHPQSSPISQKGDTEG